jgi:hypothetical protein
MSIARAADAVLRRLLPRLEAGACEAPEECSNCLLQRAVCESRRVVRYYYAKKTNCHGACTLWGRYCYKVRTQEPC